MSRFARAENTRISLATSCRLLLAIAGAASLAACAQSPVGRQKADLAGTSRQATVERPHRVAALHPRPISRVRVPDGDAKQTASHGVASFYSDTETASGERFDKNELTAAHPSLPFRHEAARHRCLLWSLRDRQDQRSRALCSRTRGRHLSLCG
ncbi:hypothetical protein ACVWZZ_001564 [Bradyrhizobium sp. LM6.10]